MEETLKKSIELQERLSLDHSIVQVKEPKKRNRKLRGLKKSVFISGFESCNSDEELKVIDDLEILEGKIINKVEEEEESVGLDDGDIEEAIKECISQGFTQNAKEEEELVQIDTGSK
eukprot:CAMPEP_0202980186 /NCGR_PEP_ID=MMETSP1396-20130829/86156_1 /ASSEMBLY_ACC=CAM_ASM_000872 /TAXON_ID= /ORGANISM="Pseudokeronopsis sp., Strain Brazil" /LENGTH=116 /DNA_ID=CAMNT_0049719995 /DNA_START=112 /DNA_END=462 /DNA_ORIENTATION=-